MKNFQRSWISTQVSGMSSHTGSARITWSFYLVLSEPQFQTIFTRFSWCITQPVRQRGGAGRHLSLPALEMSSAEVAEELPSPFVNISAIVCGHSYLPAVEA